MNRFITERLPQLRAICQRRSVLRMAIFGSATGDAFDPARSDVDVLVDFDDAAITRKADAYFGLIEDLEALFGVPVDVIETCAIRNPYFRESVTESRVVIYEAA